MVIRRWLLVLVFLLLPFQAGAVRLPYTENPPTPAPISSAVMTAMAAATPDEFIPVIVHLGTSQNLLNLPQSRPERQQELIQRLQSASQQSRLALEPWLYASRQQNLTSNPTFFWSINALALQATPLAIQQMALLPQVRSISLDAEYLLPEPLAHSPTDEPNLLQIHANYAHALGWDGFGVVVASLDTGVSYTHPDLVSRWRGGTNSWFDPYGQHDTPYDPTGHGTGVMGLMVGGDAGGTSIGLAPGARWISAKIFNDAGIARTSAIHAALQWILDPDGNPATTDTPHILNNSWGGLVPGCDTEFQPDLQVLLAAGILPIFSAGNLGPAAASNASPANLPEAFSVGGVDSSDQVTLSSSRGPSRCTPEAIFPNLAAPAENIRSSERSGLYGTFSGTSFAAPHAAGLLALILQAYPSLTPAQQRQALLAAAEDITPPGPDNDTGVGRLDARVGFLWLWYNLGQPVPLPVHIFLPLVQNAQ